MREYLLDLLHRNPLPLELIESHTARVRPGDERRVLAELRALGDQVAEIDGEWVRQYPAAAVKAEVRTQKAEVKSGQRELF